MRLTSFTDFAMRALMRLAGEPTRSFATSEIAAEFGISRNHLAKVVRDRRGRLYLDPARRGRRLHAGPTAAIDHARRDRAHAGGEHPLVECFRDDGGSLRADAALSPKGKAGQRA
jgi:Rrf2 family transcriptional regulator, nitric oxide-sensitive transcriptional repressor